MDREKLIAELTANCDCWKGDEGKKLLAMTDAQLEAVHNGTKAGAGAGEAAEKDAFIQEMRDAFGIEESVPVANMTEEVAKKLRKKTGKGKAPSFGEACEGQGMTGNEGGEPRRPQSFAEALEQFGTPQEKAAWNASVVNESRTCADYRARLAQFAKSSASTPGQREIAANALAMKPEPTSLALRQLLVSFGLDGRGSSDVLRVGEAPSYIGAAPSAYQLTDNEAGDVLDLDAERRKYDPLLTNGEK
jgi:hypothetical protein